jgi:hypothetical protein
LLPSSQQLQQQIEKLHHIRQELEKQLVLLQQPQLLPLQHVTPMLTPLLGQEMSLQQLQQIISNPIDLLNPLPLMQQQQPMWHPQQQEQQLMLPLPQTILQQQQQQQQQRMQIQQQMQMQMQIQQQMQMQQQH